MHTTSPPHPSASDREGPSRRRRLALTAAVAATLFPLGATSMPAADAAGASPADNVILDVDARAVLDWSVPRRFERSWAAYDEDSSTYAPGFVNPDDWDLDLDGCGSTAVHRIERYTFTLRQLGTTWQHTVETTACRLHLNDVLPEQGLYTATLRLQTDWGPVDGVSEPTVKNVGIRDYLIVAMGDSLTSGEGNPDRRGSYSFDLDFDWPPAHVQENVPVRWQDRRCHRSALSGPSLAAKAFEDADPKTSVTFVDVACSGAELEHLISTRYAGMQPPDGRMLKPQVEDVAGIVGATPSAPARTIDALMVSAGINDLDFSDVVRRCAKNNNGVAGHKRCVTSGGIADAANTLPLKYAKYANLTIAIRDWLPGTREVYLSSYPVEVLDGGGCGVLGGTIGAIHLPAVGIDPVEESEMNIYGERLNRHIEEAARSFDSWPFNWNVVDQLTLAFGPHAYCDRPSWFTSLEQSCASRATSTGRSTRTRRATWPTAPSCDGWWFRPR